MEPDMTIDVDRLRDSEDVVELDDGSRVVLTIIPDEVAGLEDWADCYGTIEQSRTTDYGTRRPDGFSGNAEIIDRDRWGATWWEPPTDGPKRGTSEFAAMRRNLMDIREYGFSGYVLTWVGADGREIDGESLWGIEPFPSDNYRREIVTELWAGIVYRAETRESRNATALVAALTQ